MVPRNWRTSGMGERGRARLTGVKRVGLNKWKNEMERKNTGVVS